MAKQTTTVTWTNFGTYDVRGEGRGRVNGAEVSLHVRIMKFRADSWQMTVECTRVNTSGDQVRSRLCPSKQYKTVASAKAAAARVMKKAAA